VFSRLCIVVVVTLIVVIVVVVIKRLVKARKFFKKIALSSNNLVVVDVNNKKATRLKSRINKLIISILIFFIYLVDEVFTLYSRKFYYCCLREQ